MARDTTDELPAIEKTNRELNTIDPMARDTTDELPDLFIRRQSSTQADPNSKFEPESPYVHEILEESQFQVPKNSLGSPEVGEWTNSEFFDLEESNFQTNTDNNETQQDIGLSEYSISPNLSNYNTEKKRSTHDILIRGNKKRIRKRNRPTLDVHQASLLQDSPIQLLYYTAQPRNTLGQGLPPSSQLEKY